ncbi:FAD-binding protein [bacterium]|nr:MAG: FAD-binding protein [bacterium]
MTETLSRAVPGAEDFDRLSAALKKGKLLLSEDSRERYKADESTRLFAMPWGVALPADEGEVSQILRWGYEGRFPVVTRGAGTGVAGGAVALGGGVILSLEKMDRILEIDRENLTATLEPGVITAKFQEEVERSGLFYPPDPASADSCTIGGNVAVGAGGARAVRYGTTRDYVLGMRVALADGEVIRLGGKNVKDATGYHLLELMIGSEGTLGVITEVTVRLVAKPCRRVSLLMPFSTIGEAAFAVQEAIRERILPTFAEFMDDISIRAAEKHLGRPLPHSEKAGAFVFFGLEGETLEELEEQLVRLDTLGREAGALEVLGAIDEGQQDRLWESRRTLGTAMKALSPEIGKADVVVPRGEVAKLVAAVKETSARHAIDIACFGHAGDGNVHVNILRRSLSTEEWGRILPLAMEEIMGAVAALGGRPSGEHGIGVLKKEHLAPFVGERAVSLMRSIKEAFDPRSILNPGKVL